MIRCPTETPRRSCARCRGCAPRAPRIVRLVSFASLKPVAPGADRLQWFDAEVTKPLRLAQLHAALTGRHAEDSERAAAGGTPASRSVPQLTGRVLVVEDQPLNREVAHGMLASLGVRAETAADGLEALERLKLDSFDAVLMDCEMPVMDGFSATAALRRGAPAGPRLPVIALTADATPGGTRCLFCSRHGRSSGEALQP